MNNFWQRAITGTVFVGVVAGLTLYNGWTFLLLLLVIGGLGLMEYYRIVFKSEFHYSQLLFTLAGIGIICVGKWPSFFDFAFFGLPLLFPVAAIAVLLSARRDWKRVLYLVSGILYIAIPLLLFHLSVMRSRTETYLSDFTYHPLLALNLFVLIWCSDTFAYLCGRSFGKHKLFEAVSPNKTIEGLIGGAILTIGFSILLAHFWNIPMHVNMVVALCTVVFGTLGDLVESMLKREFDIKDSGNILPGHGGILDRFDALLLSLPFTTLCYFLMLK